MYGDSQKEALENLNKSDKNRASYYNMVSGKTWGDYKNYDLLVDSSIGTEQTAKVICEYVNSLSK